MEMAVRSTLLARSAAVLATCGPASAALASAGHGLSIGPARLETVLAAGIAYAGAFVAAYLAVATLIVAVEGVLTGRAPRTAHTLPVFARRFLAGGLAVVAVLGPTLPASASESVSPGWAPTTTDQTPAEARAASAGAQTPTPSSTAPPAPRSTPRALSPLPTKAPTTAPGSAPAPAPAPAIAPATPPVADLSFHVVARGESLWRIAAEHLGRGASDAAIARTWPIIYQANRSVIGEDPGLILPGQRLVIPTAVAS